jgi:hypothetical protein
MPIFAFGLCSQIWDCLYPAPIYKIKMKSSESESGDLKISGDGSHLSFNQFQPSPPLAPMAPPADSPPPFFKLIHPLLIWILRVY